MEGLVKDVDTMTNIYLVFVPVSGRACTLPGKMRANSEVAVRQESEKLGKFLGKGHGETETRK